MSRLFMTLVTSWFLFTTAPPIHAGEYGLPIGCNAGGAYAEYMSRLTESMQKLGHAEIAIWFN
jgi:hypothetical protein